MSQSPIATNERTSDHQSRAWNFPIFPYFRARIANKIQVKNDIPFCALPHHHPPATCAKNAIPVVKDQIHQLKTWGSVFHAKILCIYFQYAYKAIRTAMLERISRQYKNILCIGQSIENFYKVSMSSSSCLPRKTFQARASLHQKVFGSAFFNCSFWLKFDVPSHTKSAS
jgi:hypothetical protein